MNKSQPVVRMAQAAETPPFLRTPMLRIGYGVIQVSIPGLRCAPSGSRPRRHCEEPQATKQSSAREARKSRSVALAAGTGFFWRACRRALDCFASLAMTAGQ
jgi:hypothetical protein